MRISFNCKHREHSWHTVALKSKHTNTTQSMQIRQTYDWSLHLRKLKRSEDETWLDDLSCELRSRRRSLRHWTRQTVRRQLYKRPSRTHSSHALGEHRSPGSHTHTQRRMQMPDKTMRMLFRAIVGTKSTLANTQR